ncbi:MAG: STM3941 family protein [Flavobacteriales bacterium]
MPSDILIHRNTKKVARLIAIAFGACALTTFTWWFLSRDFIGIGINIILPLLSVALFVGGLFQVRSYFNKRPALIISDNGVTDWSAGLGEVGVRWTEVTGIHTASVQVNAFVVLQLEDPQSFIDKLKGFRKEMAKGLWKQTGSPLALTANALDVDTNELLNLLRGRWEARAAG